MDTLRQAAIEQSAYARQARLRREAEIDQLTRSGNSRIGHNVIIALLGALLSAVLLVQFAAHAVASGGGGGGHLLLY